MTGLAQSGRRLGPAEDLLDAFAPPAADGVTGMAGGAAVDRRAPVAGVLSDMRGGTRRVDLCPHRHRLQPGASAQAIGRDGIAMPVSCSNTEHLTKPLFERPSNAQASAIIACIYGT